MTVFVPVIMLVLVGVRMVVFVGLVLVVFVSMRMSMGMSVGMSMTVTVVMNGGIIFHFAPSNPHSLVGITHLARDVNDAGIDSPCPL